MKKTIYQHCYCECYHEDDSISNMRKFFCYKVLSDGTIKQFIIYSTQIDMIIYGNYDMGYDHNTYIRVNGEYQYYKAFDNDLSRYVDSVAERRDNIFKLLCSRYPNANITIFEDGNIDVWNNKKIECI